MQLTYKQVNKLRPHKYQSYKVVNNAAYTNLTETFKQFQEWYSYQKQKP